MKVNLLILLFFITYVNVSAHEPLVNNSFSFTENKGQWQENIVFLSEQEGADVYFEKDRFHYQFIYIPNFHAGNEPIIKETKGHIFDAQFIGSNPNVSVSKGNSSHSYKNYFIGNDRSKWASRVYNYDSFEYKELYSGIDLFVYTTKGQIKYDYLISAGSSPKQIQVQYNGVDRPIVKEGNLIIAHTMGELIEERPYAYQLIEGVRNKITCNYVIDEDGLLHFEFPQGYDETKELIIDPVLIFSTYSGSFDDNWGMTATYDKDGNGFMGGLVFGPRYVTTLGALQTSFAGGVVDIAIAKSSSNGDTLKYATFLGGSGNETVHSMVADSLGNLYIFGVSSSSNFPTSLNAYDRIKENSSNISTEIINDNQNTSSVFEGFENGTDIIIARLDKDGDSLWSSTFFGGNESDGINFDLGTSNGRYDTTNLNYNYGDSHRGEIVLDSSGNCYVGTSTLSSNLQNTLGSYSGGQDGLLIKLKPELDSIIWARYIGGTSKDAIYSIKVIDSNKVIIGGGTTSSSITGTPTSSYQNSNAGGRSDGYISIIASDGSYIEKSTFIGTSDYDQVYFVEFDRFNNVYAFGQTGGGSFPRKNDPKSDIGAGQFIVKLDRNLDSLEFSTTFGRGLGRGAINISPTAFLVDKCQNIYTSGWGGSLAGDGAKTLPSSMLVVNNNDPTIPSSTSSTANGDFYLYVFNRSVDSVLYASYFGGISTNDHVDGGTSRFDKNGIIYQSVCGSCGGNGTDFPTTPGVFGPRNNSSNCNNALFKLDFEILINAAFIASAYELCLKPGETDSIRITNTSVGSTNTTWNFYGDTIVSGFLDTTIYFSQPGIYTIKQVVFDSICATGDFLTETINVRPDNIELTAVYDSIVCYLNTTNITFKTNGFASRFKYSTSLNFDNPINSNLSDSIYTVNLSPGINSIYIEASNPTTNACIKIDSVEILYNPTSVNASVSATTVCEGTPIQFNATVTNIDSFAWKLGNGAIDTNLNTQFSYLTPGTYTAYFLYENYRCKSKDSISFNLQIVTNDLEFLAPDDTLYCGTGNFDLSLPVLGNVNFYQWSSTDKFVDQLNTGNSNSIRINTNDSATYHLRISNQYCEAKDSITAQYIQYGLSLEPLIDSACVVHFQPVQASVIGADSFQIVSSNGTVFTNDTTPLFVFTQQGNYTIKLVTSNTRCNRKDSIIKTISILETVDLKSIPDTLLCKGDSVILTSNSKGTAATYTWSINPDFSFPFATGTDSSIAVSPSATTNYYIQGKNSICTDNDTVEVTIEDLIIDVNDFESFCIYDTISLDAMVISAASPLRYSWTPTDSIVSGQNLISAIIAPLSNQFYYLYTKSLTGCEDFDTVEVEVNLPAFNAAFITAGDSLFKGQQTLLTTNRNGNNLTYQWEPADNLDDAQSPSPTATLSTTKTYRVTITDLNTGCIVIALKRIHVFEVNCGEPDIFIPTAFSPNDDLTNDVLFVRGANIRALEFQLFNRWGELVFETRETNRGWNGTYKGKKVDPGVFVYQVKAICFDGQEYIDKGNITLLK